MLVLGIDPGCTSTGFGLVRRSRGRYILVDSGAIRTRASETMESRLAIIFDGLEAAILRNQPDVVAIEAIFKHKSSASALKLGQARGVALLAAAQAQLQVYDYNAMTVKKTVSGSGRADKTQMSRVVQMLVGQEVDAPHDATDAIAIAITHLSHAAHHAALEKLA